MPETGTMFINGWDVANAGLHVEDVSGWRPSGTVTDRGLQILGRYGSAPASPTAISEGATMVVQGVVEGTTAADVRAKVDLLRSKLFSGILELSFYNNTDKIAVVWCEKSDVIGIHPQWTSLFQKVVMQFHSPLPVLFSAQPVLVAATALKSPVPLGTGPCAPVFVISGAVTNPVITYRDLRSITVKQLAFSCVLAADDYLVVDCWRKIVTLYDAGVASDGISLLSGYWSLDALSPDDGNFENSVWPTIEVSPDSAIQAQYRKVYV